jgi:hypothetical protein
MESSKLTFPDNRFLLEYRGSYFKDEETKSAISYKKLIEIYRYLETTAFSRKLNQRSYGFGKD